MYTGEITVTADWDRGCPAVYMPLLGSLTHFRGIEEEVTKRLVSPAKNRGFPIHRTDLSQR